ncbi:response regulator [Pseudomonas matsuisoli]|uniref:Uncharacterized protein n=1 Tax=Pseudomonas matsuisoli TaxID=1515666 RepID=A0A917UV82_9PSED|nr:response regulator [Pseudomonas matsuisoli]GGJ87710.1 hypothetical protein GCM10009304_11840 [Pseudomonas matsuisoli]
MVNLGSALISLDGGRLKKDGTLLPMSRPAEQIFKVLLSSLNQLVTKEELLSAVWPDRVVEENNLQVHISSIRKIAGLDRATLETVSGRGYRLNVMEAGGSDTTVVPPTRHRAFQTVEPVACVHVVDDECLVKTALVRQLRSAGITALGHASADEFLATCDFTAPSCLLLDVRLAQSSGFDLQAELAKRQAPIPIVFMTGFGTIDMSVRAMKAGAESFLTKPMDEAELLRVVSEAMIRAKVWHEETAADYAIRGRYDRLSEREKEVFKGVVAGYMNKEIAMALGVQEVTVKVYKKNVMLKMGATKLVELIDMSRVVLPERTRKTA